MKLFALVKTNTCAACQKQTVADADSKHIESIEDLGKIYVHCPVCSFPLRQILTPISELKHHAFQNYLQASKEYNEAFDKFVASTCKNLEMADFLHLKVMDLRSKETQLYDLYLKIPY